MIAANVVIAVMGLGCFGAFCIVTYGKKKGVGAK